MAGVSVDYYIRLEQGRGSNVSDAVLDAVARALRLTETERTHLYALARPSGAGGGHASTLRPGARLLLNSIAAPAFILGRRMDVPAWNALGDAISGFSAMPPAERNQARYLFTDPTARTFYPDWDTVAAETVAYLRRDAGLHPDDTALSAMVADLSHRNPEFHRLWSAHPIKEKSFGAKRIHHPDLGLLDLTYETLALPGDPDHLLVVYTAAPNSPTAAALATLELTAAHA